MVTWFKSIFRHFFKNIQKMSQNCEQFSYGTFGWYLWDFGPLFQHPSRVFQTDSTNCSWTALTRFLDIPRMLLSVSQMFLNYLSAIPKYSTNNGHVFSKLSILLQNVVQRFLNCFPSIQTYSTNLYQPFLNGFNIYFHIFLK